MKSPHMQSNILYVLKFSRDETSMVFADLMHENFKPMKMYVGQALEQ